MASKKLCVCNYCGIRCKNVKDLGHHEEFHTGDRPLDSQKCGREFNEPNSFFLHTTLDNNCEKPCGNLDISELNSSEIQNPLKEHYTAIHTIEKVFSCDICSSQFLEKSMLTNHQRTHVSEKLFECNVCNKQFKSNGNLKVHSTVHSNEKPFCCDFCPKTFRLKQGLKLHMLSHTKDKKFECHSCHKTFSTQVPARHLKSHSIVGSHNCLTCNQAFKYRESLKIHVRKHSGDKPFECPLDAEEKTPDENPSKENLTISSDICGSQLGGKYNLSAPSKVHASEKQLDCNMCEKKSNVDLKAHSSVHCMDFEPFEGNTEEKNFVCHICHNKIPVELNVHDHLNTHTHDHPFKCATCNGAFNTPENLEAHQRIHTRGKPFKCPMCVCDKHFSCLMSTKRCILKHTGERPFKCEACQKSFRTCQERNIHLFLHSGEKPFQCAHCSFTCATKIGLKRHEYHHQGLGKFHCFQCSFSTNSESSVTSHTKKFHCTSSSPPQHILPQQSSP